MEKENTNEYLELLEIKIKTILEFQQLYPTSYIGGSFSLFLRGIDLKRSLWISDLDLVSETFDIKKYKSNLNKNTEFNKLLKIDSSHTDDFRYIFKIRFKSENPILKIMEKSSSEEKIYIRHDIAIRKKLRYDNVIYNNNSFRVAKIDEVVSYKKKYFKKYGNEKHKYDIQILKDLKLA
jgi:hypothetical protein